MGEGSSAGVESATASSDAINAGKTASDPASAAATTTTATESVPAARRAA